MAGGPNAELVACIKCTGKAQRTSEGLENDLYKCTVCGSKFGIDWEYDGPPKKPRWPITQQEAEKIRELYKKLPHS